MQTIRLATHKTNELHDGRKVKSMDIMDKIVKSLQTDCATINAGFDRVCPWCGEGYPVIKNASDSFQYADYCGCGCPVSELNKKDKATLTGCVRKISTNIMHEIRSRVC